MTPEQFFETQPLRLTLVDRALPWRRRAKLAQMAARELQLVDDFVAGQFPGDSIMGIAAVRAPIWNINAAAGQPAGNVDLITAPPQFAFKPPAP